MSVKLTIPELAKHFGKNECFFRNRRDCDSAFPKPVAMKRSAKKRGGQVCLFDVVQIADYIDRYGSKPRDRQGRVLYKTEKEIKAEKFNGCAKAFLTGAFDTQDKKHLRTLYRESRGDSNRDRNRV